jgi:hypothetical protein
VDLPRISCRTESVTGLVARAVRRLRCTVRKGRADAVSSTLKLSCVEEGKGGGVGYTVHYHVNRAVCLIHDWKIIVCEQKTLL